MICQCQYSAKLAWGGHIVGEVCVVGPLTQAAISPPG